MDDPSMYLDILYLLIFLILILLSAFFSGSETSFFALNKFKLYHLVRQGDKNATKIYNLLKDKETLITSVLFGNNLVNIAASSISTYLFIKYLGNTGVILSTIVVTFVILIFSEITPKIYSSTYPQKVAFFSVHIIEKMIFILKPFIIFITYLIKLLMKMFSIDIKKDNTNISKDELKTIFITGESSGFIDPEKRKMLNNLLEIGNFIAKDIMIPRIEVLAIDLNDSMEEIFTLINAHNYSRYPVYEGSVDNIIGILHTKKLLKFIAERKNISKDDIKACLQKVYYTSEFTKVEYLLKKMKQNNIHIGIVVDEYGGFEGIVTLEDILEEIVGEIQDEFDEEGERIEKINEKKYIIDGDFSIKKFNEIFLADLPYEDEFTLAGFFISLVGYLAKEGDSGRYGKFNFTVLKMEKFAIKKLQVDILDDEKIIE